MASELRVNTLKDAAGNNSIATSFVAGGSAKAHANYKQTSGSESVVGSFNVASVTDVSGGKFTVNFTSAMSNTNYAIATYARRDNDTDSSAHAITSNSTDTKTASACKFKTMYQDNGGNMGLADSPESGTHFMGDLA